MKKFLILAAVVMAAFIVRAGVCAKPTEEAELLEFLRFPSVSTDPAHRADCERCADWLVAWLTPLGFTCEKHGKSQAVFEEEMRTTASGGERGRSVVERNAFRPTLELNGFASGYGRSAPLMVGFGQASNRTHATNENFGERQFRMCRAWAKGLLSALGKP